MADFTPVTLTSWGTLLLVTNPDVQKAGRSQEVVEAAKAARQADLCHARRRHPHHLSMALFCRAGHRDAARPVQGHGRARTDMLGGRIDYMFLPAHVAAADIQAGKLKAIATGSSDRLPQLPDVPTLGSRRHRDNVDMWYGFLRPRARRRMSLTPQPRDHRHPGIRPKPRRLSKSRASLPRPRRRRRWETSRRVIACDGPTSWPSAASSSSRSMPFTIAEVLARHAARDAGAPAIVAPISARSRSAASNAMSDRSVTSFMMRASARPRELALRFSADPKRRC